MDENAKPSTSISPERRTTVIINVYWVSDRGVLIVLRLENIFTLGMHPRCDGRQPKEIAGIAGHSDPNSKKTRGS